MFSSMEIPKKSSKASRLYRRGGTVSRAQALTEVTFVNVAKRMQKALGLGLAVCIFLSVVGVLQLLMVRPEYAPLFGLMTVATCGGIAYWRNIGSRGLPMLPVLLVQHGLIYALPLAMQNPSIESYSPSAQTWTAVSVSIALIISCVAWKFGREMLTPKPSRYKLRLGEGGDSVRRCMVLAVIFMGIGVSYELASISGLLGIILPNPSFNALLRAFCYGPVVLGGFLGGFALSVPGNTMTRLLFWILTILESLLVIRNFTLAAVMGPIFCLILGLVIGRRKIPWVVIGCAVISLGVLNRGKFSMREKYWAISGESYYNSTLDELPSLYVEWLDDSMNFIQENRNINKLSNGLNLEEKGQSLAMRVDNLQNILFFVEAMNSKNVSPMMGASYALIPPLLVPRFLWPDKPRGQEGQVRLNLHFGRQLTVEETEKTYFSVGLLPEAVGNFGAIGGGVFFGLVSGLVCGMLESWSSRKKIFSVEGMIALGFLLQLAVSMEMSASTLVTSTFQLLIAISIGGLTIYYILGDRQTRRKRLPRRARR